MHRIVLFLAWIGVSAVWAAENFTADFYRENTARYLGKQIKLRVAAVEAEDSFTQLDPDFVWLQASTGRPKKEEGKIFLRVPKTEADKLAKMLNQPSTSGRLIEGKFYGKDLGPILPGAICQQAPIYLQTGRSAEMVDDGNAAEPVSGSLVVAPRAQAAPLRPGVAGAPVVAAKPLPPLTPPPVGLTKPTKKQWVVCRSKIPGNLELKLGQSVQLRDGVYEVVGEDGKLSVLGQSSVVELLPYPDDAIAVTPEEAKAALKQYADLEKKEPGAIPLLAQSKGAWEKRVTPTVAANGGGEWPKLEEVETAAGVEEPTFQVWPWLVGGLGGVALFAWIGWLWFRRSAGQN